MRRLIAKMSRIAERRAAAGFQPGSPQTVPHRTVLCHPAHIGGNAISQIGIGRLGPEEAEPSFDHQFGDSPLPFAVEKLEELIVWHKATDSDPAQQSLRETMVRTAQEVYRLSVGSRVR